MIGCHYHRRGVDGEYQLFESTADTRSNWDPAIQHGSPPLALLTKAIEECAGCSSTPPQLRTWSSAHSDSSRSCRRAGPALA